MGGISAKKRREGRPREAGTKRVSVNGESDVPAFFPVSGSGSFGPPTVADPEHRVIGQASPS